MEKKITYNEVYFNSLVASAIPIAIEGRKLPQDTAASVILMQVGLESIIGDFEKRMQKALEKMKERDFKGYDERARAIADMEDVDRRVKAHDEWDGAGDEPPMPTEEEIAPAEKTRETEADFRAEEKKLADLYVAARTKELNNIIGEKPPMLTRREFADIIGMLGTEGTVTVNRMMSINGETSEMPRTSFIAMVAANLVEP